MRSVSLTGLLAGIVLLLYLPADVGGQSVTVVGRVVEASYGSWVGGARVELSGRPPHFTDLDGVFQFARVPPGRYTLTVTALGYRTRSLELSLRADTVVVVEMDPDPIVLDSLLVRAGRITISGEIKDALTGARVLHAQVTVLPDFPPTGAVSGYFAVRRVPVGRAVTVLVESVGYFPARIALITEADTTLNVELAHDSVAIRMVAQQVEKLEARSQGVPRRRRVTGAEELARYPGWTVQDIVSRQLALYGRNAWASEDGTHPCLFVDDVQQRFPEVLYSYLAGEVERIEIYDRGGMIRVYTRSFLVSLMGRELPPIIYMKIGLMSGRPVCK